MPPGSRGDTTLGLTRGSRYTGDRHPLTIASARERQRGRESRRRRGLVASTLRLSGQGDNRAGWRRTAPAVWSRRGASSRSRSGRGRAVGRAAGRQPGRDMRVAVLGTGRIGAYRAGWLRARPEVEEVLVASIREGSVETVLDARPDAVVISSATPDHPWQIRACAERGLPMLCEKPIALTLHETRAALDVGGELLQVSFQRRFDPAFAAARQLVADGTLGTLYCVRMCAYDHEPSPEHFVPGSGGIFRDLHVHDFDVARWLTGSEVERVYAVGAVRRWERFARHGDVDTAAIVLTMADGLPVVVTGSRHNARGYDFRLEVLASEDSISVGLDKRTPLRPLEASAPPQGTRPY